MKSKTIVTIIFLIAIFSINCSNEHQLRSNNEFQPIKTSQKFPENFKLGGTLRLASNNFFNSLDPHNNSNVSDSSWGPGLIYDRILKYEHGENVLLPSLKHECLICSKWTLEDEQKITFTIPNNLTWNTSPPTTLTTSDIEFSINRIKNQKNYDFLHMIQSIDIETENKISFQLRYPDSDFLMTLADVKNKIVSKNLTENSEEITLNNSIGSNSWSIEKFSPLTKITLLNLRKNDDQPFVDAIEINVLTDSQTRLSAYMVGLIDVYEIENLTHTHKDDHLYQNQLNVIEPSTGVSLTFNTSKFPYNNRNFRNAIINAIDIDEIQTLNKYFALGMPLIDKTWEVDQVKWQSQFNNPNKFSDNIEQSKVKMPMTIKMLASEYDQNYSETINKLTKQLALKGFLVETTILNNREYASKTWDQKDFDISVGPQFPQLSPNSFLFSILHSKGKLNSSNTYNVKLDKLIEEQSQTYNSQHREKIIQEINSILFDEMYRLMINSKVSSWTWTDAINNFYPNFYSQEYKHWDKVWIER